MTLTELQRLVKNNAVEKDELLLDIQELRDLGINHRRQISQLKTEIVELRRQNTRMRSQRTQMVDCITSSDEFREWVIERGWISGASDLDMAMAFIAARPEIQS